MDYDVMIDAALQRLHDEGRYRTFIDIERRRGAYPRAMWRRPDGTERPVTLFLARTPTGAGALTPVVLVAFGLVASAPV